MIHEFSVASTGQQGKELTTKRQEGLPGGKRRSGSRRVGRKYFAKGGRGTRGSRASVENAAVSSVQLVQGRPIDLATAAE